MFGDERASAEEISLFLVQLQGWGSAVSETTKLETRVRMCCHPIFDFFVNLGTIGSPDRLRVDKESGMVEPADEAESLPLPLRQYVDEDNRLFQEAIDNWDSQPTAATAEDVAVSGPEGGGEGGWGATERRGTVRGEGRRLGY